MTAQYPPNVNPVQPPYGQPQFGYPQQPAPPKKRRTGSTILIALLAVVMLTAAYGIGYAVGASGKSTVATVEDQTGTAPTATAGTAKAAATTKAPAKAKTVLAPLKGNGTKNTAKFTTGNDWVIHYSYDCTNFGGQGNFAVSIGAELVDANVNELGKKGTGTEPVYNDAGTHYLSVLSECSWTISVTA